MHRGGRWAWGGIAVAVALAFLTLATAPRAGSAPTSATLLAAGSSWRYLDNGTNQGTAWRVSAFDHASWKTGSAELGYGDGDERTVVSYGPSSTAKYNTTYFWTTFSVANPATVTALTLQLRRDDGAVVYLNGAEVARSNLPAGTIASSTRATTNIEGAAETTWNSFSVSPSQLAIGTNAIAVEVHQQWAGSSDLSFDLAVNATVDTPTSTSSSTSSTSTSTSTSTTTTTTTTGTTFPVLAAGDLAKCPDGHQSAVATLVAGQFGPFLPLGDLAYPHGSATDFSGCYNPAFGPFKSRSHPAPGNHEYDTGSAAPYLAYFGNIAAPNGTTWYSFNVGNWHFVSIDSDCSKVGGCGTTSAQYRWVAADLAATTTKCVAAFFHHTPWSSTPDYDRPTELNPILTVLQQRGTDILLTGHMHNYERFARMNAQGQLDSKGFRNFVVGTGGEGFFALGPPVLGSEVRNDSTFGILRLDLAATGYTWKFLPVAGSTFTDSGSDTC